MIALALDLDGQTIEAEQPLLATVNEAVPRGMVRSFLDEGTALIGILDRVREKARKRAGETETLGFNTVAQRLLTTSRHPDHGLPGRSGSRARVAELTAGETEVLRLVDQGRSNKEIARALAIGVETVKWYLKNIFVKQGVSTRTQAISESRRLGGGLWFLVARHINLATSYRRKPVSRLEAQRPSWNWIPAFAGMTE